MCVETHRGVTWVLYPRLLCHKQERYMHGWTELRHQLLQKWRRTCALKHYVHDLASKFYGGRHTYIHLPAVLLSLCTTSFLVTDQVGTDGWRHAVAAISLLATVLGSANTVLRYGDLRNKHRASAEAYECIELEIADVLAKPHMDRDSATTYIMSVRNRLQNLIRASPSVPDTILDRYARDVSQQVSTLPPAGGAGPPAAAAAVLPRPPGGSMRDLEVGVAGGRSRALPLQRDDPALTPLEDTGLSAIEEALKLKEGR